MYSFYDRMRLLENHTTMQCIPAILVADCYAIGRVNSEQGAGARQGSDISAFVTHVALRIMSKECRFHALHFWLFNQL
jgi:hypothetical protein